MITVLKKLIYTFITAALMASCSSLDCPMNSHVCATYGFYSEGDKAVTLNGLLSVSVNRMDGNDTTLVNKQSNARYVQLPMSYLNDVDELVFMLEMEGGVVMKDVVSVAKTNDKHFESVECGANYFHTLTSVTSTNNFIDSVRINNKNVNLDATQEHVQIFLKH